MLVNVIQIKFNYTTGKYSLEEMVVNPEHVVSVVEETKVSQEIRVYEAKRPSGLDARVSTSTISMVNGSKFIVIGAPEVLLEKFSSSSKPRTLLRG